MIQRMFVTLDTKKTNYKNVGKINHGDDLILELTVLSDGNMISFNDPMVDLLVKKSDGKMIRQNSGIEHIKPNKFIIEVSKDCVTSPGLSTNQLIINDNGRISTCMFYYTILNSLEEDIIESISNVEVLEQLDEFTIQMKDKMENFDEELQNRMSELEDAIDDLVEFFGDTSVDLLEAELSRNEAEQSRAKAESVRVQNENRRLQNDLDLANAEAERVRAENIRIQNEVDRALVDAVMDQKESQREDSELERIQNESKRATDELVRQQNENVRQSNEATRIANESNRKSQENRRATAETNRVNAETTRRNNENSRISNETERQKTMNEMKSLLEDAHRFDDRIDGKASRIFITYEDFGAVGDGVTDDGNAIKTAHAYANENNLSVKCMNRKRYLIKNTNDIEIKTDLDLNGSTVVFDDMYRNNDNYVFRIDAISQPLSAEELEFINTKVDTNTQIFTSMSSMNGYVVVVENDKHVVCTRRVSDGGQKTYYKEVFAIDDVGSMLCDNYQLPLTIGLAATSGSKYKIDNNTIKIENGYFEIINNKSLAYGYNKYVHINRSNVILDRLTIKHNNDLGLAPRKFFINEHNYNVVFKNINGMDFHNNGSTSSTYLFANESSINATYDNINSTLYSLDTWGCFQSYRCKDMIVKNSSMSRFDSHFNGVNITIADCIFGDQGIQVHGCGTLRITNTNVYSSWFIACREDYGGSWDGDIIIKDCSLHCKSETGSIYKNNVYSDFDYGIETVLPNIIVDGFEFKRVDTMIKAYGVMMNNTTGRTGFGRIKAPSLIDIKNVRCDVDFSLAVLRGDFAKRQIGIIKAENIHLPSNIKNPYLSTNGFIGIVNNVFDESSYSPTIYVNNCTNISIGVKNTRSKIFITDCILNRINTYETANTEICEYLSLNNVIFNSNIDTKPTASLKINRLNADRLYYNNVYYNELKMNNENVTDTSYIFNSGFFTETNLINNPNCVGVKFNPNIAGVENLSSTVIDKLKFNIS